MTFQSPDETQGWIYKADMNLKSASVLNSLGLYDAAYYLAQKSAETYLKAILSSRESPVSSSRNLIYLLKKLNQYDFPVPLDIEQNCRAINEFMGLSLEPGCYISEQEGIRITEYTKNVRKFCLSCLAIAPQGHGIQLDFDINDIEGLESSGRSILN